MSSIAFIILFIPMIVEIIDDKNGEKHPSPDLLLRVAGTLAFSFISALINPQHGGLVDTVRGVIMSVGIYVFVFPYLVNIVLYRRGVISNRKWWDHLSATAWPDRLDWWRGTPWYARMFITAWVYVVSACIYFDPCSTIFQSLC